MEKPRAVRTVTGGLEPQPGAGPAVTLEVFQSLWAMEDLPRGAARQWSLAERVEQIAGAGFAGLAVDLGARQKPAAAELAAVLAGSGLKTAVFAFIKSDAGIRDALAYAAAIGARQLVVCGQVFSPDPAYLAATVRRWHALAAAAGVDLQLETHRGTMTNELRATTWLLEHLDPRIRLAADLSHLVCGCELPDTPEPESEALIQQILARAGSLQGRIASRCQIQVPLGYPDYAGWEQRFRTWWRDGFAAIRAHLAATRPGEDAALMFCTELGTRPYAMVDRNGEEISDRWAEALVLKAWAEEAFAASGAAAPAAVPVAAAP
jgi:hypothetical protein